jgi:hypothetical protein
VLLFLRIYAVAYLVLFLESLAFAPNRTTVPSPVQLIDLLFFTPVAVVGLWSAAYRHINLPKHGWKVLLFASVFWRPFTTRGAQASMIVGTFSARQGVSEPLGRRTVAHLGAAGQAGRQLDGAVVLPVDVGRGGDFTAGVDGDSPVGRLVLADPVVRFETKAQAVDHRMASGAKRHAGVHRETLPVGNAVLDCGQLGNVGGRIWKVAAQQPLSYPDAALDR